ncbi:MAG: hypothetical protein O6945_14500 [Gammaproteobacteria bacterium]|nr:hypothetical protein [Gammaproteobacteria bacterium]
MNQTPTFDSNQIQRDNIHGPGYTSYPIVLQFGDFHPLFIMNIWTRRGMSGIFVGNI